MAVDIARWYERVGIWEGRTQSTTQAQAQTQARDSDGDKMGVEEMSAMEEGRDLEEVVGKAVLDWQEMWVRWCGWRGIADGVGLGLFGWVGWRVGRG